MSACLPDIEAFILIGGRSSRFGSDKAFAAFGNETLVARAVRTVNQALSPLQTNLVVSRDEQLTSQSLENVGCSIVADRRPGLGAWSGIDAALAHARTNWVLVLACDLPLISAEFLQLLAGRANGNVDAVVPRQPDGRLQPLCAIYRLATAKELLKIFLEDASSLPPVGAMFEKMRTCVVAAEEYGGLANAETLFSNINTPADLTAAKELEYHQSSDKI